MKRVICLCFVAALVLAPLQTRGELLAYWNMDNPVVIDKINPNAGSQAGSIDTFLNDIAVGFSSSIEDVAGTTDNIIGTSPSNRAIGFYRVGVVYANGSFRMDNFDFTNFTGGQVSFAVRGQSAFTWDTNLEVDYRVNNGAWQDIVESPLYTPGWSTASIDFDNVVGGFSDVDFRIRFVSWSSTLGYLDIDNVQVNGIPEPASVLLLAMGSVALLSRRRTR